MSGHFGRTILVCDGYVRYHLNRKKGVFMSVTDHSSLKQLSANDRKHVIEAACSFERRLEDIGYRRTKAK